MSRTFPSLARRLAFVAAAILVAAASGCVPALYRFAGHDGQCLYFRQVCDDMTFNLTTQYRTEDYHALDLDEGSWTTLAVQEFEKPKRALQDGPSAGPSGGWRGLDARKLFKQHGGFDPITSVPDAGRRGFWGLTRDGGVWFLPASQAMLAKGEPTPGEKLCPVQRAQGNVPPPDKPGGIRTAIVGKDIVWFTVAHAPGPSRHLPWRRDAAPDYVLALRPSAGRAVAAQLPAGTPQSRSQCIRHLGQAVLLGDAIHYTAWREQTDTFWLARLKPDRPDIEDCAVDLGWKPKRMTQHGPRLLAVRGKVVVFLETNEGSLARVAVVDPEAKTVTWQRFPDRRWVGRGLESVVRVPARAACFLIASPFLAEYGKVSSH